MKETADIKSFVFKVFEYIYIFVSILMCFEDFIGWLSFNETNTFLEKCFLDFEILYCENE